MKSWIDSGLESLKGVSPEWWHVLVIMLVPVLYFAVRAVAVIVIGRCVKPEIAKLALPLLLRPKEKRPDS